MDSKVTHVLYLLLLLNVIGRVSCFAPPALLEFWKMSAEYAIIGYCSEDVIKSWSCKSCQGRTRGTNVTTYFDFNATSTQGFIGYNREQKIIITVYQATNGGQDWRNNFKYFKTKWPGRSEKTLKVHRGFLGVYKPSRNVGPFAESLILHGLISLLSWCFNTFLIYSFSFRTIGLYLWATVSALHSQH